jgi:hypothetical protein
MFRTTKVAFRHSTTIESGKLLQQYVLIYHDDGRLDADQDRFQHVAYAITLAENTYIKSCVNGIYLHFCQVHVTMKHFFMSNNVSTSKLLIYRILKVA